MRGLDWFDDGSGMHTWFGAGEPLQEDFKMMCMARPGVTWQRIKLSKEAARVFFSWS